MCVLVKESMVFHGECHAESGSLIMLSCTCDVIVAELTCLQFMRVSES